MSRFNTIIQRLISNRKIICGFTTRKGGVSQFPFDSFNLGYKTSDDSLNIKKNREILYSFAGVDEKHTAFMEQIHGNSVSIVKKGGFFPETDGLLTSTPGIMLGILVADCIPLLLFDPVCEIIGAVHCGWRPIISGIAEAAVNKMSTELKTEAENIIAVMGPSAGPCCYETGSDTAVLFHPSSITIRDGKLYADLRAELRDHLISAGVISDNIETISDCTVCNESLYFSYRRDNKNSGRMMGFIMIRPR